MCSILHNKKGYQVCVCVCLSLISLPKITLFAIQNLCKLLTRYSAGECLTDLIIVSFFMLHRTYTRIRSHDQRQSYKQDFNREYSEYRDLHARIDGVTRQFMELDTQLKQLHRESRKYKVKC